MTRGGAAFASESTDLRMGETNLDSLIGLLDVSTCLFAISSNWEAKYKLTSSWDDIFAVMLCFSLLISRGLMQVAMDSLLYMYGNSNALH